MSLREILSRMAADDDAIKLTDRNGCYRPRELLDNLSAARLDVRSHYQPGLYIARIDEAGYLGTVLYRVEK